MIDINKQYMTTAGSVGFKKTLEKDEMPKALHQLQAV